MHKRIVKPLALTLLAGTISMNAAATGPGMYFGIMFGPATNSGNPQQAQILNSRSKTTVNPRSKQFGSRLAMGYQFNRWSAFELGFSFFSTIHYSETSTESLCSSANAKVRDIELVGKGIFPFYNYFDIFGKAGIAVTYTTTSGALNPAYKPSKHITCGSSNNTVKYDPTFSIGASYNVTQNFVTDITFTEILTGGAPNTVSWAAIGFWLHFVDKYCGQFLCD